MQKLNRSMEFEKDFQNMGKKKNSCQIKVMWIWLLYDDIQFKSIFINVNKTRVK